MTNDKEKSIMNTKEPVSIFLNSSDQLYINAKKIKPIEGYQDIVIHGSKNGYCYKDKDGKETAVNPTEFSDMLKNSGLLTGDKIRLISCEAAAEGANVAQWLADDLGIEVLAPSDIVWVDHDGNMTIGRTPDANDGRWVTVKPRKSGD